MKQFAWFFLGIVLTAAAHAQQPEGKGNKVYRATPEKVNDLVHTRLDCRFDYAKSQMAGKAWITLRPHFYPTDSLELDAKGMDIRQVALVKGGRNVPLKFAYDGLVLDIQLDKTYRNQEPYTVYIDYTARPDEYKAKGSAAITDARGLYFINPRGEQKDKPTQIWTQGETEATSVWLPTIDRPNQRTTQEMYMTVPAKYVTLSNGKLVSQKNNADGTRTDYWKMDQPHAPYLFFMGVGDFAVIRDKYKDKEVSYYVEKEYAPVARRIFGKTPEMIALYSKLTGVDYPWVKYAQIVGRDYVSGAMENTTATLHQEAAQQDARELADDNRWEEVIAHELFHQWFGDYVTTESWSNITLNESFATIGSQLWNEFHYGKDFGDAERYNSTRGYLNSRSEAKDLVRFFYTDKEDVFDAVSYNKGAAILQMLRNFVGDSAFFKSINLYLTTNKFKAAEATQLRLAFEEVTGKDLNWFWNQWYYGAGHPNLNITYNYMAAAGKAQVIVEQKTDKVYVLPVAIDVWSGSKATRHKVWVSHKSDTFLFPAAAKPSLINFDSDKILVAQKTENKSLEEYLFQYRNAGNYIDRREAMDAAINKQDDPAARQILTLALKDRFAPLRSMAVNAIDLAQGDWKNTLEPVFAEMAQKESNRLVKAAALNKLGNYRQAKYASLFLSAINDSSYTVSGNALDALSKIDSARAVTEAKRLSAMPAKGRLASVLKRLVSSTDAAASDKMIRDFDAMPFGQEKFKALEGIFELAATTESLDLLKRAVDAIQKVGAETPESFRDQVVPALNTALREVQKQKLESGHKDQSDYILSKLPKEEKKDF